MRKPDGYAACSTTRMKTLALVLALATGCAGSQVRSGTRNSDDDELLWIGVGSLAVVTLVAMVVGTAAISSETAATPTPLPQPPPRP